jgi:branched-chain amino acid transport system ATP-binding protein
MLLFGLAMVLIMLLPTGRPVAPRTVRGTARVRQPERATEAAPHGQGDVSAPMRILSVKGVNKRFGGLQALSDVGLEIRRGQIYGLIGPNGAGKTTFFNVITGLYTPDAGSFVLDGQPYEPTAVHKVAEAGIARTFQNIRLFGEMTALENVMVGRHVRTSQRSGARSSRRGSSAPKSGDPRARWNCSTTSAWPVRDYQARTLSYGDQRRLEIARALATDPSCWPSTNRPPA